MHPRQSSRLAGFNRYDTRMGIFGPQRRTVQHTGKDIVVGKLGGTGDFVDCVGPGIRMAYHPQRFYGFDLERWQRFAGLVFLDRGPDGAKHAGVACAATRITRQGLFDFLVAGNRFRLDHARPQRRGRHEQSGCTEPALHRSMVDECFLQGMELARTIPGAGQAFDREHFLALHAPGRIDARAHRPSIDQHHTGTTLAITTSYLGTGQSQVMAQYIGQFGLRRNLKVDFAAVYSKLHSPILLAALRGSICDDPEP